MKRFAFAAVMMTSLGLIAAGSLLAIAGLLLPDAEGLLVAGFLALLGGIAGITAAELAA